MLKKAKVTKNISIADATFELVFVNEEPFRFEAGQFVTIKIDDAIPPCFRAYSILSTPTVEGKEFSLCIKYVEGGRGSTWLQSLKEGDEISFMGPNGQFAFKTSTEKNVLFIATGTGLAPLLCFIEDQLNKGAKQKMHLIFGVRYIKEIFYEEKIKALSQKHPNFTYDISVSRPEYPNWQGNTGRVTDVLEKMDIKNAANTEAYICGLKAMIESVQEILKTKGLTEELIHFEKFD